VAAEAEVSEGYAVAFGAGDRVCGCGMEGYAWLVGGAAAVGHTGSTKGGIGIIASLLLLRGRRHTLYAFVTRPSPGPLWPALRALSRWRHSGLCRALQGRLEHAQSYRRQANLSSLQSVQLSCPDEV
jgi:hypothetical protein